MITSSLFPLIRTYQSTDEFEETITIEMLQSLDLVLRCRSTLDAFEKAILNDLTDGNNQGPEYVHL